MSIKYDNVIIFGATGDVGSYAALEASKRGAQVWLAMRDTEKVISNIDKQQDQKDSFKRVKADLTDPASVKAAIEKSGAKAAYFYMVQSKDFLRDSIFAMRDAGIEYCVFLSTANIMTHNVRDMTVQEDMIGFFHAQAEIALEDTGIPFTAIRPGFFASNNLKHNLDTSNKPWEAVLLRNEAVWDNVSPLDIGRLSGSVLVNPPSSAKKEALYIYGPQLLSQDAMWEVIQKAASQEIKITYMQGDDYEQYQIKKGIPPPFAKYFVTKLKDMKGDEKYPQDVYKEGSSNLEKYAGYQPQTFSEYIAANAP